MNSKTMNKLKRRRNRWKPKQNLNGNCTRTRDHKWGLILRRAEDRTPGGSLPAADEEEPPIIPSIPPEGRKLDIHESAMQSQEENSWLKDWKYNLDQLKTVQCTWKVELTSFPETGYAFRIYLLWDYDRLWGVFNLGHTKGVMLVDPGPRLSSSSDGLQQLSFIWRGVLTNDLDTYVFCDESISKGEIWIHPCHKTLSGYFDFIAGNGMAGGERCHFRGKPRFGPPVVPYSLEDVVDEWNEYGASYPVEGIRQDLPFDDLNADLRKRDKKHPASAVPSFPRGRTTAVAYGGKF
ncbi:hypothetical protein BDV12DRAFT_159329 [Aspergillus spectabilis]